MANYNPPIEDLPIFDSSMFLNGETTITQNQADKRYLRYPNAQGTENLQQINVNGISTFNSNIVQTGNNTITQSTTTNTPNTLKTTLINSNWGDTLNTPTLKITDNVSTNNISFYPNLGTLNYNPIVQASDKVIMASPGGSALILSVASSVNSGLRITNASSIIGYGGTGNTPTNSITCNASSVRVLPALTFIDNKVQNSAFTGGTPGTYTNTNMTIDANGKISAISNGTIPPIPVIPFAPRIANYSDTQSGTSGYSQGTKINWGGTWGVNDYIMVRVSAFGNWGSTGLGWLNYASSSGILILRPYYAPANVWANTTTTMAKYTTNQNNANIGSIGKAIYYTNILNNGTQSYFYIYGAASSIEFNFTAPGASGGWEYSHLIEYICHSYSGGTISFTNGTGTNSRNDYLP
jgi:hypothetical protein